MYSSLVKWLNFLLLMNVLTVIVVGFIEIGNVIPVILSLTVPFYIQVRLRSAILKADIKNICDFTDNNYDHYFVIAGSHGEYLIDPSFIQFVSNNGKLIAFDEWPATVLKNANEDMANGLIKYGYVKLENDDLKQYLGSFIEKSKVKR